jgi:hypothetical protein
MVFNYYYYLSNRILAVEAVVLEVVVVLVIVVVVVVVVIVLVVVLVVVMNNNLDFTVVSVKKWLGIYPFRLVFLIFLWFSSHFTTCCMQTHIHHFNRYSINCSLFESKTLHSISTSCSSSSLNCRIDLAVGDIYFKARLPLHTSWLLNKYLLVFHARPCQQTQKFRYT